MTTEEMVANLVRVEEQSHRNEGRIKHLELALENLSRIATAMEVLTARQEKLEQDITRLTDKVDALEQKPGRRWESVAEKTLLVLVGSVVALALSQAGISS